MWSPEKNKEDNEPDFEHCVQREGGNRKRGSGSALSADNLAGEGYIESTCCCVQARFLGMETKKLFSL